MQIKVKSLTGNITKLEVKRETLISDVKNSLMENTGIPTTQMRLIFVGRMLADSQTIEGVSLTPGGIMHMVLSLRGGV